MAITIEKPLRLSLDVLEMDERLPSMKMQVDVIIQQFLHKLSYSGSVWFDCSSWENFIRNLKSKSKDEISLVDMNGFFTLTLRAVDDKKEIFWEIRKPDISGAVATATYCSSIDDEALAHIVRQFVEYERWW